MIERPSDEYWSQYRRYADRVVVAIKPTDYPGEADSTEEWIVVAGGAEWDPDWLIREVESIALDFRFEDGRQIAAEHVLEAREHRFSWGADSTQFEIVMWLISWAATSASWDLLKVLAKTMATKLGSEEAASAQWSEQEIVERAKWLIAARYSESIEKTELISVEITAVPSASVHLRAESGWHYIADFQVEGELVTVGRVKKFRSEAPGLDPKG